MGSIFLDRFTSVKADYYARGTSHVLPASGYTKTLSGRKRQ